MAIAPVLASDIADIIHRIGGFVAARISLRGQSLPL
jgi:hypothetical protein